MTDAKTREEPQVVSYDIVDLRFVFRLYERLFRKLVEDLLEAYHRTPLHVSSRPYIERALNLALAGLDTTIFLAKLLRNRYELKQSEES